VKGAFEKYLLALRKAPIDDKTEHTDRSALETLLQTVADEVNNGVKVQHEPKRAANKGAPDFKITKSGLILGYVETKGVDENLNKVLKSEQLTKYKSLSDNIILTDYLDFIWINKYGLSSAKGCATRLISKTRNSSCMRTGLSRSPSCCKASSRRRPKASARRRSLRWRLQLGANCCEIFSARNSSDRSASTGRSAYTGFSKYSASRCSMN